MVSDKRQTLGDNVVPVSYKLVFEPNLKTFKFNGTATIEVKIKKKTSSISLNSKELRIKGAVVTSGKAKQNASVTEIEKKDEIVLGLKDQVSGSTTITIEFEGIHNDKMYGFYRSRYTYKGKDGFIATSQFEAASARTAFPCFDEPEFKATYEVTIIVDPGLDAISNMPVKSSRAGGKGKTAITFATTPKMSSYLLYLAAGKFEFLESVAGHTKIRMVTTPGKRDLTKLALRYASEALLYYEKYFNIKFPLPKIDFIAVPDFAAGAMENWGAITFRESALLCDEKTSGVGMKEMIAEVIAHELTHQWFGDLVTMKWWEDLWLNESFATFMAYKAVDSSHPDWKMMIEYYLDTIATAMGLDALKSSHPISVTVNSPEEISAIFDAISYEKGGSVLYMLEDYVGKDVFRNGLSLYLKKHSYSSASKADLWNAIQEASKTAKLDVPAAKIMDSWINQIGYPVVTVKRNETGPYMLEQKRYTLTENNSKQVWPIPIHYTTDSEEGRLLMTKKTAVIKSSGSWLKLNYGQTGLYRAYYDDDQIKTIGEAIRAGKISDIDASGFETDLFSKARSGRIRLVDYTKFVNRYMTNCGYPATSSVSGHLWYILTIGKGEWYEQDARRLSVKFHTKLLQQLGWNRKDNESTIDTKTRGLAISGLGLAEDRETILKAKQIFDDYVNENKEIDNNIKSSIYAITARNYGDQAMFDMFLEKYEEGKLPEEKLRALGALGAFRNEALLEKALDTALTSKVRLQDSIRVIGSVGSNPASKPIMLKWLEKNWAKLLKMYDPATHMLYHASEVATMYSDKGSRDEVKRFFEDPKNIRDDIRKNIAQALEVIDANIKFIDMNRNPS